MSIFWDNIEILRKIDQLQRDTHGGGVVWSSNGLDLIREMTGTYGPDETTCAGLLQELRIAKAAGLLDYNTEPLANGQPVERSAAHLVLQHTRRFALTVAGQDRARNRVLGLPEPERGQDDGRDISGATLDLIAASIRQQFRPDQLPRLLHDAGVVLADIPVLSDVDPKDTHAVMIGLHDAGGSHGRTMLRGLIGGWIDDRLPPGPTDEDHKLMVQMLGLEGWFVRGGTLVIGERVVRVRADPASNLNADARDDLPRVHSELTKARGLVERYPAQAATEAMQVVETRIRALAQRDGRRLPDETRFGHRLATTVFNPDPGPPVLDVTRSAAGYDAQEQDGWKFVLMGALAALRNPLSHKAYQPQDPDEVLEVVMFASMLLRGLDLAEQRMHSGTAT